MLYIAVCKQFSIKLASYLPSLLCRRFALQYLFIWPNRDPETAVLAE